MENNNSNNTPDFEFDIEEEFESSSGTDIDFEDFERPETGTGFFEGNDGFIAPTLPPINRPESDPPEFEAPEVETPDFEPPDFEPLDFDFLLDQPLTNEQGELFDGGYYLRENPDVAEAGISPERHFRQYGRDEGRSHRFVSIPSSFNDTIIRDPIRQNVFSPDFLSFDEIPRFDQEYYLEQNPDLAAAGVDPLTHFRLFGLQEGREYRYVDPINVNRVLAGGDLSYDPLLNRARVNSSSVRPLILDEREFELYTEVTRLTLDREFYEAENPDVVAAGIDSFDHYLSFGRDEGRTLNLRHELDLPSGIILPLSAINSPSFQGILPQDQT